eukprot:g16509.t1
MTSEKAFRKLQVLCLHGHAQTGDAFRSRIGSLRTPLKKYCDFHFIDGPFVVPPCAHSAEAARSWLEVVAPTSDVSGSPVSDKVDVSKFVASWEASVRIVRQTMQEKQIDALMGFSLGAALILGVLTEAKEARSLRFVALFSGFVPDKDAGIADRIRKRIGGAAHGHETTTAASSAGDLAAADVATETCTDNMNNKNKMSPPLPSSFHCYGLADEIITAERSKEAASLFAGAGESSFGEHEVVHFSHPGGHLVPSQAKNAFRDFVQRVANAQEQ